MTDTHDINVSLEEGKKGEAIVKKWLESLGHEVVTADAQEHQHGEHFDLFVGKDRTKVEVKYDGVAVSSGNFFLEYVGAYADGAVRSPGWAWPKTRCWKNFSPATGIPQTMPQVEDSGSTNAAIIIYLLTDGRIFLLDPAKVHDYVADSLRHGPEPRQSVLNHDKKHGLYLAWGLLTKLPRGRFFYSEHKLCPESFEKGVGHIDIDSFCESEAPSADTPSGDGPFSLGVWGL